jgi:hypothetical protein
MTSRGAATEPTTERHAVGGARLTPLGAIVLGLAGWLGYVLSLELRNPRLVPSWHGFLHTAIANRFPAPGLIPENPFYAGEPLPYYWAFHRVAATLGGWLGLDPLTAMRYLTLFGLVLLVITAVLIGWRVFRSAEAGLLIGVLALVGLNPGGPALATARHLTTGVTLFEQEPGAPQVETVFTSNETADSLMSRNLLGRMYFSTDWRHGENIVWFLDISSRGLALAMVLVLAGLTLRQRNSMGMLLASTLAAAMLTALNPIVGLAVSIFLGLSLLVVGRRVAVPGIVALALGVIIAAPTFYHLFGQGGGGTSINPPGLIGLKLVNMGINFVVLLPLALLALRLNLAAYTIPLRAITLTGILLLLVMVTVHLEEGNEHNLTNAAQVILAIPAVAVLVFHRDGSPRVNSRRVLALIGLIMVPVAAGTWLAFDGRPPLPFATTGGELVRTPANDPLPALYQWIKAETPREAIFVVDPAAPVKMSGNVSELPAFTGRGLFTDQASYLTTPFPDAGRRTEIARQLVGGAIPNSEDEAYLWRVRRTYTGGKPIPRPLYIVSYAADDAGVLSLLAAANGAPKFHSGFVAAFLVPERSVVSGRESPADGPLVTDSAHP